MTKLGNVIYLAERENGIPYHNTWLLNIVHMNWTDRGACSSCTDPNIWENTIAIYVQDINYEDNTWYKIFLYENALFK